MPNRQNHYFCLLNHLFYEKKSLFHIGFLFLFYFSSFDILCKSFFSCHAEGRTADGKGREAVKAAV